jgi:hypothetical protein
MRQYHVVLLGSVASVLWQDGVFMSTVLAGMAWVWESWVVISFFKQRATAKAVC